MYSSKNHIEAKWVKETRHQDLNTGQGIYSKLNIIKVLLSFG